MESHSTCFLYVWLISLSMMPSKFIQVFFFLIYLFLAVLGLRFCVRAFSSCGERGPLFIAVRGPLTIVASLVAEHRLQTRRLSNCGSRTQLLRVMWDPPRPGLEPVSPALAGRFSTTAPPGKPASKFWWTSFLRLKNIPLYVYTTFCLSIHPSMDTWVASTFCLWWMMLCERRCAKRWLF